MDTTLAALLRGMVVLTNQRHLNKNDKVASIWPISYIFNCLCLFWIRLSRTSYLILPLYERHNTDSHAAHAERQWDIPRAHAAL